MAGSLLESIFFVISISRSQNPPYQGARQGINFHSIPCFPKPSCIVLEVNNFLKSSAADMKVEALSDTSRFGKDLRYENCLNTCKKVSSDRSVTTSRCTALVLAHVNKHMYALDSPFDVRMYSAPVKSIPVTENGFIICNLCLGRGGGLGAL